MRRALTAFVLSALAGCAFEVNLGSKVVVPDGGFGGGFVVGPACGQSQLFAYEVTLEATPIPASCWLDAGTPQVQLPEERFTAVFLSGTAGGAFGTPPPPTMALVGFAEQRLGDTAPVKLGEAFAGLDRTFEWNDLYELRERVGGPMNQQQFIARFDFDRLDTELTAGRLLVHSSWQCVPGEMGACPQPLPFAPGCTVERRFIAQRGGVPSNLASPPQEPIPGATQFLVSIDVGEEEGTFCWGSPAPRLVQRKARAMRRLERWQRDAVNFYVPARSWMLGDAPAIAFGPVVPVAAQEQSAVSMDSPDAREVRTTLVRVNATPCNLGGQSPLPEATLTLESAWSCEGSGCSFTTSTDHGTCRANLALFAVPIEAGTFSTSP